MQETKQFWNTAPFTLNITQKHTKLNAPSFFNCEVQSRAVFTYTVRN